METKLLYEEALQAADTAYEKDYSKGDYCHEQSFAWGFQEGVSWLYDKLKTETTNI